MGRIAIDTGWDSAASLVDGRWIERVPRRPEVAERLRREAQLMPWLGPQLPLRVPEPWIAGADPLVVRHALVVGAPVTEPTAAQGAAIGRFLQALHGVDVEAAVAHGLTGAAEANAERDAALARFAGSVVPMLPARRRSAGRKLLAAVAATPADTVVHGDLGPEHLLTVGDTVGGVIDWTDAHVGDAALDLSWSLHATPAGFADALAAEYRVDAELRHRSLLWHRLAPWHEALYGIDTGRSELVESGLSGALDRL